MRISIKTLDLACVTGLLVLAVGGTYLALKISGVHAARVERHNGAVGGRLAELDQAQSVLSVLDRALRANQAALETLRTRLPETDTMGEFLSSLDRLAGENAVDLRSVQPAPPVREALCNRTPIRVTCRGAFRDLHALVYHLEVMDRLVRIDTIKLNRESAQAPCTMDLHCSVYAN